MPATVPIVLRPGCEVSCPAVDWLLVYGSVRNDGAGVFANVEMDLGSGRFEDCILPVPITRKGTVLELIRVHNGCSRLRLMLEGDIVDSMSCRLFAEPVGYAERVIRMWSRVVPMIRKFTRKKRLRAGLTIPRLLFDLQGAYRIAGKLRGYVPQMPYADWLNAFDCLSKRDVASISRHSAQLKKNCQFLVFITVDSKTSEGLKASLSSLSEQFVRAERIIALVAPETNADIVAATLSEAGSNDVQMVSSVAVGAVLQAVPAGKWCVHLQAGDRLSPHALYWIAAKLERKPWARVVYTDDDQIGADGKRMEPRFKPAWSLELLRSTDYIGNFFAFSADLARRTACCEQGTWQWGAYGLLLALSEALVGEESVEHIPALLCHRDSARRTALGDDSAAVAAHLARLRISADVERICDEVVRIAYVLTHKPLVSILIPTRDAVTLLKRCVDSVVTRSSYRNFELLLLDNGSVEPETVAYFQEIAQLESVRVLRYDAPFNYSAMNNLGVAAARGEVVCLLNNDTEVITPDWLELMLGHLLQDRVGVVGAKLLYPDGRVQHGGDTVGPGGCAHHLHSFLDRDAPGYCNRAIAAQDLSAVTAACLVTWRHLYQHLGGLDEQNLKIAFNDVDYCLRVREAGYRVVWTPHAQLYHHESASRGKNDAPDKAKRSKAEADYIRKRWRHLMGCDPYYNVNCSYERPDFSLSNAPMVTRPWER